MHLFPPDRGFRSVSAQNTGFFGKLHDDVVNGAHQGLVIPSRQIRSPDGVLKQDITAQ